jgi:predicted P-loop ATPase
MSVARDKVTVIDGGKRDEPPRKKRGGGGSGSGGGRSEDLKWQEQLIVARGGEVKATAHNLMLILEHDEDVRNLFWLDEFANRVRLLRDPPWTGFAREEFADADATELCAWLGNPRRYSMPARADAVMMAVEAIARRAKSHPVRNYLRGLKWDGEKRLERMFVEIFGADDIQYTHAAAKCFLVSAVARILWIDPLVPHNGAQVDFMLVLEGPQGKKKTSAVRELFGHRWYVESMESPSHKDFYQSLQGRWGVEIGEMDSFGKADITKVRQAITARFDHYRPSYGRYARSFRRECVFVGTVNENEYLRDPSGGRRFLPVRVMSEVDIPRIREIRDQLWAEAVVMFDAGFEYWKLPADAAAEQEKRFVQDSWEEIVGPWIAGRAMRDGGNYKAYPDRVLFESGRAVLDWTTTSEILSWALRIEIAKHGKGEQMRVAAIMKRLGWHPHRHWAGAERERRWVREKASDDPPF